MTSVAPRSSTVTLLFLPSGAAASSSAIASTEPRTASTSLAIGTTKSTATMLPGEPIE